MKKRLIAMMLCVILAVMQIAVVAASFPDVDASKYGWAIEPIEAMAEKKIINGFPDGTFQPEQSVTRIDALLLISRILGAEEKAESKFLEAAEDVYFADVNVIGYPDYQDNLAYLLYRGLYTPQELRSFVAGGLGGQALKRHEAAVLLTKTMNAEAAVKANTMPVLSYADASTIPAAAKAYVEYCYDAKLMQGMEDNKFNPNYNVTRAQMAVMLYKAMDKLSLASSRGTVTEVSGFSDSIKYAEESGKIRTVNLVETVPAKLNGTDLESIEGIQPGDAIHVIYSGDEIAFIEVRTVIKDQVIEGVFSGKSTIGSINRISIYPLDGEEIKDFVLADDVTITRNGQTAVLKDLTKEDHVVITIQDSKVSFIEAKEKDEKISGYIAEFVYGEPSQMKIKLSSNEIKAYHMASKLKVTKNGNEASVTDLLVGDKVSITLEYGIIKSISATSTIKNVTGTIQEIVISKNPTIKIETANETIECAMLSTLDITINGEACDVYALRLGYQAKVTMESSTVTKIEVTSSPAVETLNVVGTVKYVDTNYMFITLETADGEQQIFVKKNANIMDSQTQKAKTLSAIKAGSTITAVISSDGFVPEAISIVVLAEPK